MDKEMINSRFGVGVIVTTLQRDLFFVQQKDDEHPLKEFRLKYSIFGGLLKEEEDPLKGLKRELYEELDKEVVNIILNNSLKKISQHTYLVSFRPTNPFTLILFESIITEQEMKKIKTFPINEGNGAFIVTRKELKKIPIVEGMEKIIKKYLEGLNQN